MDHNEWLEQAVKTEFVVLDVENYFYNTDKEFDIPVCPAGEDVMEWRDRWHDYCYAIGFQASSGLPTLIWTEMEPNALSRVELESWLHKLVSSVPIVCHNTAHDTRILTKNFGVGIEEYMQLEDTMLMHNILWAEFPHTLNFCQSLYGSQNRHKDLGTHSVQYLQGDVWETMIINHTLKGELAKDPESEKIYRELQLPLLPITHEAHIGGVRLDQGFLEKISLRLEKQRLDAIETAAKFVQEYKGRSVHVVGKTGKYTLPALEPDPERTVNMNSPKQMNEWLYIREGFKIKHLRKGKSGLLPFGKDQVAALQEQRLPREEDDTFESRLAEGGHPLIEAKAAFTQADRFLSGYIRPNMGRERCYPQFKLHGQATGRWSTTGPNIPGMNKALKPMLIPDEGHVWVGGDWSNAELRIMAEITQDEALLTAFAKGWDLHSMHTAQAFGWDNSRGRFEWMKFKGKLPDDARWADYEGLDYKRGGWWGRVAPGGKDGWKAVKIPEDFPWEQWLLEGGPQPGWMGDKDLFRRFCKILVFRLMYGGSPKAAGDIPGAVALGVPTGKLVQSSRELILAHPSWQEYWDDVGNQAVNEWVVRNWMGRKRKLMSKQPKNRFREGVNFPIQSTVSDLLNKTLRDVKARAPWCRLMFTIHDSFYMQCKAERAEELQGIVLECAEAKIKGDFFIPFDMERIEYNEVTKEKIEITITDNDE